VKALIVNADDFGMCSSVNRGIARAYDDGIVTSASLMVRRPAAAEACAIARERPGMSLGLHFDIAEWVKGRDGWAPRYQVVDPGDHLALREEARWQLERFQALSGAVPTHLDSHQHVHRDEPFATVVRDLGAALSIPIREGTPRISYRGDFYGQTGDGRPFPDAITSKALGRVIGGLGDGITELGCHPAADGTVDSVYGIERAMELRALCDPRVREAIRDHDVILVSFGDVVRSVA
jgi:predicted glycoside hydrolase/deacetylase ChbG (UPF0249 family)